MKQENYRKAMLILEVCLLSLCFGMILGMVVFGK